jgi:hypothetical protein
MSENSLESHNMHLVMKYVDDCKMRALRSETIVEPENSGTFH